MRALKSACAYARYAGSALALVAFGMSLGN
jgi:hypothetical protein